MMKLLAGNKLIAIAVIVLVVGLTSYFTTQYIQKSERDSITIELQDKQRDRQEKARETIKNSVGNNAPDDDASDSLQWFKSRQGNQ